MTKSILIALIATSTYAGSIHIDITGVKQPQGHIYVGLYNQANGFLHTDKSYKNIILDTTQQPSCTFSNIPKGRYAIALFHDQNNNGKLDRNIIGIPKEQTGTSNNVVSHMGPPSFIKARFEHTNETDIVIKLR